MLEGIVRESTDKKTTKALRRDGYLIGNIYGTDQANINVAFKRNEFIRYVKTKDGLSFKVKLGSNEIDVVIQEYQRDPLTLDLLHVDLRSLDSDKESRFYVPLKTVGSPKGLKNKGCLVVMHKRIPVKCKPSNIPNFFEVDVTKLDTGDSIMAKELQAPEGIKILLEGRVAITGVIKAK